MTAPCLATVPPLVVALGRAADALELLAEDRRALSAAAETVGRVPMLAAVVVARTANVGKVLGDLLGELDGCDDEDALHLDLTALRGDLASWDATAKRLDEAVATLRERAADLLDAREGRRTISRPRLAPATRAARA